MMTQPTPRQHVPLPAPMPELVHGDARNLQLPDESVDLIVTSPPYFGLRDYGTDGQLGAEPTPADYIKALIECTAEMVRVLKPTGSIFVNLGDKYATRYSSQRGGGRGGLNGDDHTRGRSGQNRTGIPEKSLMLLPERYRIAAVDELGLIARAVLIWAKPNPVPSSATDRVARKHEDWVHLTRSPHYFANMNELREPCTDTSAHAASRRTRTDARLDLVNGGRTSTANPGGKLPGSVWTIPTQPLKVPAELGVDHFAAFPMEWPRRIILGWCPPGGTVLDPFGGTGTTALVAAMNGRRGISVDLSEDYQRLATWRAQDPKQRAKAGAR